MEQHLSVKEAATAAATTVVETAFATTPAQREL